MEPDHETGLTRRAVAGATRSDGSASADSPSASVARSLVFANAVNSPTLYLYCTIVPDIFSSGHIVHRTVRLYDMRQATRGARPPHAESRLAARALSACSHPAAPT